MLGHSSGSQQPLLHGGTHHSPYGGSGYHNHDHDPHNHNHHHRPAPIVQPSLPHTHTDTVVVKQPPFRLLRAFIYTAVILILVGALVQNSTTGWAWGHKPSPQWTIGPGDASPDYPVPSGVDLTSCESPLKGKVKGKGNATFQIPSSSDSLLLFAGGRRLTGAVRITTTTAETDSVKFTMTLVSGYGLPADTIVCSLKRGDGEEGVGIFNPKDKEWDTIDLIHYHVTVELPENHPVVKRFESDVIDSSYDIDDLQGKILFEALSLHGTKGGLYSKSISARWANISTSYGPIKGYFNVSDFLKIHTVVNWIEVDIDFNQDTSDKAVLSLSTTNNELRANLRLQDVATSRSTPANFDVITETTNGPLSVVFLDAPVDSTLSLQASTQLTPAEVTLHPTFEGHFSLSSTVFVPAVRRKSVVEDPSGRGRDRFVSYGNVNGHIDGDVAWGEGPKENRGKVDVRTSAGWVTLNL